MKEDYSIHVINLYYHLFLCLRVKGFSYKWVNNIDQ